MLQLGGCREVGEKHEPCYHEEAAGHDGEELDLRAHSDSRGQQNEAIYSSIVQRVGKCLVVNILVAGEVDQEVTHRGGEEEVERGIQNPASHPTNIC